MSPSNGRFNPASADSLLISEGFHVSSEALGLMLAEPRVLFSSVCWSGGSGRFNILFAFSTRRMICVGSSFDDRVFDLKALMPPQASGKLHSTTITTSIFSPWFATKPKIASGVNFIFGSPIKEILLTYSCDSVSSPKTVASGFWASAIAPRSSTLKS